jgi:hypothetical protein
MCIIDMLCHMRTTINVPDDLFRQVKRLAVERSTTVTAIVEGALREVVARKRLRAAVTPVTLTTFGSGGLLPGVALDDSAGLLEVMEGTGGPHRR